MWIRIAPLAALLALGAAAQIVAPGSLAGQEPPDTLILPPLTDTATAPRQRQQSPLVPEPPISPGQAFLRALIVPGWGHASIGSYTRGGFYFATEAATALMMVRVAHRRSAAEEVRDLRVDQVEQEARDQGITDPVQIQDLVDADEGVDDARRLVEARAQQFEDWLALGVFLVLLGGADAYVSAHLAGFPRPVDVRPMVVAPDRYGVAVSVPLGKRRGR